MYACAQAPLAQAYVHDDDAHLVRFVLAEHADNYSHTRADATVKAVGDIIDANGVLYAVNRHTMSAQSIIADPTRLEIVAVFVMRGTNELMDVRVDYNLFEHVVTGQYRCALHNQRCSARANIARE
jgi:hypothetical protein